jgi:hypothetical protein
MLGVLSLPLREKVKKVELIGNILILKGVEA